jgi:protein-tyrosine-phosphatase
MEPYNVLFLCTGNSARSILAEALLEQHGAGRFRAFSAGSRPRGEVHPLALELLQRSNLPTAGLRSKSWDEFSGPTAPKLDFVFTVCGNAAHEVCPVWPGGPLRAHWGIDDPAAVEGSKALRMQAFERALAELEARIRQFLNLPLDALDVDTLRARLQAIGAPPPTEP